MLGLNVINELNLVSIYPLLQGDRNKNKRP